MSALRFHNVFSGPIDHTTALLYLIYHTTDDKILQVFIAHVELPSSWCKQLQQQNIVLQESVLIVISNESFVKT
jgi:hypothetical protein